ncbi:glycosyltransferase family 1 protein [Ceratobasidium sp. AG-I]|nr:glycosyltransferase family 1 protein [Ceratobasidium sp. AG-I]
MIIDSDKASSSGTSRPTRSNTTGTHLSGHSTTRSAASSDENFEPEEAHLPTYSPREQAARYSSEVPYDPEQRRLPLRRTSDHFPSDRKSRPPAYGSVPTATTAFQDDGRLEVSFDSMLLKQLPDSYSAPVQETGIDQYGFLDAPPMHINIMIVGSRGDVQPYLALGQKLQEHGHTVRLATHATFRQLVKDAGLRFFNIGGDPHELMSYMVRNPGLVPGFASVKNGDIGKKQKMVAEILDGCWRSCYESDDTPDTETSFAADAIISNPPAFAHIHCAEALGIPLLMSFTMPWSATSAFPHPLVNVKQSKGETNVADYYSYGLVDIMTWQGLGHTINKFRSKKLGLTQLSTASAVSMIERCKVPWTYCISPALVPKPTDWMGHIDVVGFYFLNLAKTYVPPLDLEEFLNAEDPPIYIGFGSIVVDNPQEITQFILDALSDTGVRAVVSAGWGGLDVDMIKKAAPNVFLVDCVPHDWLFERVSAVCHHGGAGTTAIGLKCGKPTIVIPFFGDQFWWATQIARRGAGPAPLNPEHLTSETIANAIRMALSPDTLSAAQRIGELIRSEDGAKMGAESFFRHLPLLNMRCDLDPKRIAVWYSPKYKLRLSALAAQILIEAGEIDIKQLTLHRAREYDTEIQAGDPLTGSLGPLFHMPVDVGRSLAKLSTGRPDKAAAKLLGVVPKFVLGTVKGTHEGFQNIPKAYGGGVRVHGKVTDFESGVTEGAKGFFFGVYDGFTGLVMEPVRGYKEHGVGGALMGVGKGTLNSIAKPLAGMFAGISHPLEGAAKSVGAMLHQHVGRERQLTRYKEGILQTEGLSQEERQRVVVAFGVFRNNSKGKQRAF